MAATKDTLPSNVQVGFIGAGKMAQAMVSGFLTSGLLAPQQICASDPNGRMHKYFEPLNVTMTRCNEDLVKRVNVVILAVKPHIIAPVLAQVGKLITKDHLVISIAAAINLPELEEALPAGTRVVRVMPNTPCLVQAGASIVCRGSQASDSDVALVKSLCNALGICEELPEKNMNAAASVSGSGPAYVCMAIEALADGGVKMGLPRDVAMRLAAQTMVGTGKMVLETGSHPGQLKDAVCSPGGTTIAGVAALEQGGYRYSLLSAVEAATVRSVEIGEIAKAAKAAAAKK